MCLKCAHLAVFRVLIVLLTPIAYIYVIITHKLWVWTDLRKHFWENNLFGYTYQICIFMMVMKLNKLLWIFQNNHVHSKNSVYNYLFTNYISRINPYPQAVFCRDLHDDITIWKRFSHMMASPNGNISPLLTLWEGIHRSPMDSPHDGQWRGALMFSLTWPWTNGWANNRYGGDLRYHCAHYDVTLMRIGHVCCQ